MSSSMCLRRRPVYGASTSMFSRIHGRCGSMSSNRSLKRHNRPQYDPNGYHIWTISVQQEQPGLRSCVGLVTVQHGVMPTQFSKNYSSRVPPPQPGYVKGLAPG
eukprot:3052910-Rhodomonas_salina.1